MKNRARWALPHKFFESNLVYAWPAYIFLKKSPNFWKTEYKINLLSFFKAIRGSRLGSIVAEGKLGFKSAWRLFVLLGQLFCLLQFVKRTPSQTIHLELITLLTAIFPSQSYLTSFLSNPRTVEIFCCC